VRSRRYLKKEMGLECNPHSMFDIHVKRIHEYKRQVCAWNLCLSVCRVCCLCAGVGVLVHACVRPQCESVSVRLCMYTIVVIL